MIPSKGLGAQEHRSTRGEDEPGFRALPCMVSYTPGESPYIDQIDERVGVAVDGNAWGWMTSDEIGRLAADMMRGAPWLTPLGAEMIQSEFA